MEHLNFGDVFGCLFGGMARFGSLVIDGAIRYMFDRLILAWHLGISFFLCYSIYVMSNAAAKKSDDNPTPPEKSTVVLLFTIAADTTWRMFAPTFGGMGIGALADMQLHTSPWGAIVGLAAGIVVTALLVRQQLKKGNGQKND